MNNAEILQFQQFAEARVNPQVEDGHVRIANDLFDEILRHGFTHRQQTVLLAVIRKTYGFNKKEDDISKSQLAGMTGLHLPHIGITLRELADMNVIEITDGKYAQHIKINKYYDTWKQVTKSVTKVTKTVKKVTESVQTGYQNSTHNKQLQKTDIKPSTSKNKFSDADMVAAKWMFAQIRKVKPDTKAPNLNSWANTIRLLVEIDGRSHKQVCELFQWANKHPFWFKNILCPDTLRKQWDKLDIERQGKPATAPRKRGVVL